MQKPPSLWEKVGTVATVISALATVLMLILYVTR